MKFPILLSSNEFTISAMQEIVFSITGSLSHYQVSWLLTGVVPKSIESVFQLITDATRNRFPHPPSIGHTVESQVSRSDEHYLSLQSDKIYKRSFHRNRSNSNENISDRQLILCYRGSETNTPEKK
jgi:hypothetical protein